MLQRLQRRSVSTDVRVAIGVCVALIRSRISVVFALEWVSWLGYKLEAAVDSMPVLLEASVSIDWVTR